MCGASATHSEIGIMTWWRLCCHIEQNGVGDSGDYLCPFYPRHCLTLEDACTRNVLSSKVPPVNGG